MLTTNKQYLNILYDTVNKYHRQEVLPSGLPEVQHAKLIPKLRPYQVRAVKWMLSKELISSDEKQIINATDNEEKYFTSSSGGILADEMGLGKTVEVLACILAHPRPEGYETSQFDKKKKGRCESNEDVPIEDLTVEIKDEDVALSEGEQKINKVKLKRVHFGETEEVCSPKKKRAKYDNYEQYVIEDTVSNTIEEVIEKYCTSEQEKKAKGARAMLQEFYDMVLAEMSPKPRRKRLVPTIETDFQCCCTEFAENTEKIQCPSCMTWQHSGCVGHDPIVSTYDYYCFKCWQNNPLVPSAGTVIISPDSISGQWVDEVEKHLRMADIKLLVYKGVRSSGYIQPTTLAEYDIVITTYEVLRKELDYVDVYENRRTLRYAKKYYAPNSPLICVDWWRVCLDEAQMIEGSATKAAEMAKKFYSTHRWAVTGTPIQKSVHDLSGLMQFLNVKPYSDYVEWKELVENSEDLMCFLPKVMWRTPKRDVLVELGVPPQHVIEHWLKFSAGEEYFYQTQHNECSTQFLKRVGRFKDLNIALSNLDRREVTKLLLPLLRLRQACSHPQAVRGKFLSIKRTMTMPELLATMVSQAKVECEEVLRQLIASLNGIAALFIIKEYWIQAVDSYRSVLHLNQDYEDKLKIDSLQRIHTMHNLAEVLDADHHGISRTLRDSSLREDTLALEKRYLEKREAPLESTKENLAVLAARVAERSKGATLGYSDWWLHVLEHTIDHEELLDFIKSKLTRTDILHQYQHNTLANKLKDLHTVRVELAHWLGNSDSKRQEVIQHLRDLQIASVEDLALKALACHLPQSSATPQNIKRKAKCPLCRCETVLKAYEALLFQPRDKTKRKESEQSKSRSLPGFSKHEEKVKENRAVADLVDVNVNTFEYSKKGGFQASQTEVVLRSLASYCRSKHMKALWSKDAKNHLLLLNTVKKEFLFLNLLWRQIFDQVAARDELNMAKMRLRLPLPEEIIKDKKKKKENIHIILPYKVDAELQRLLMEQKQCEGKLKKKSGTLLYLQNLQKEGEVNSVCPICKNNLQGKCAVLLCGHSMCLECLSMMLVDKKYSLSCPQCRQLCNKHDVSYVEDDKTLSIFRDKVPGDVVGSHSTKVQAVLVTILDIIKQQPQAKVLIFSTWEKVLDVIAEGLDMNRIRYRRLKPGPKQKSDLKEFKVCPVSALLLRLHTGAKGLNLIEATHVFLVEPILNPADELQAVGRVHRIGQTKETYVHRFVVRGTIEEKMTSAIESSDAERWSNDELTLKQLFDLFTTVDESMNNSSSYNSSSSTSSSGSGSGGESSQSHDESSLGNFEVSEEDNGIDLATVEVGNTSNDESNSDTFSEDDDGNESSEENVGIERVLSDVED